MLGLLLLATVAAYLPSLDGDFVLDDFSLVQDPRIVAPLANGLSAWLNPDRPVVTATFALNHATVGLDTRSWHITNVLIHLAAVVLAWRLARRLLDRSGLAHPDGAALAAAALFALHPLQTESVSYITQRAESLASALYLAALLALLDRDEATSPGKRRGLLAAAGALQLTGLLVKPIVATMPAAWLLAAAVLPIAAEEGAGPWRRVTRRLPAAVPLFGLSVAAAVWGITAASGSNHAGFQMPDVPMEGYLATQLRVIPSYLRLLAWPQGQCADCFVTLSDSILDPAPIAGAVLIAAVLAGSQWLAWRASSASGDGAATMRLTAFGLPFFLLVLSPSSSLIPLRDPLAEHRVYLAILGLFIALVAAAIVALRRWMPSYAALAGWAILLALLGAAGAATAQRNVVWSSRLAFYRDAALTAPDKARVHLNFGAALMEAQRYEEALASFRRAARMPEDRTASPRVVFENVIAALIATGRLDEARREVVAVLELEPDNAWARALLAEVEFSSGRPAAAEAAAQAALRQEPGDLTAVKYLGLALAERGDHAGAALLLRAAAAANSIDPAVFHALGEAEAQLGNRAAACQAHARAAAVPGSAAQLARARAALARLGCR